VLAIELPLVRANAPADEAAEREGRVECLEPCASFDANLRVDRRSRERDRGERGEGPRQDS
jgi:hypothetical protein